MYTILYSAFGRRSVTQLGPRRRDVTTDSATWKDSSHFRAKIKVFYGGMGVIMMMVMKATTTTTTMKKTTVGGDGLLSFFSIPNDCFIVLVYMHYHCFEYLFMHQIFSSGSGFFFVCLFVCLRK